MNDHSLIKISTNVEVGQKRMLEKLVELNPRVTEAEHHRRSLDMYLSTPSIQADLAAAGKNENV